MKPKLMATLRRKVGAMIGGVVGGGAGYMFGDGAIKTLRGAYDRFANGTPWNQVDTRSPHERLVTPAATSKEAPAQASYSNEGRNHPTEVVTPEPPKTVRGMNGRTYLDGAVTGDDHSRAETLINGAFGNRGKSGLPGEENMNMLRNNAASMDMYNQGLAAKGSGIQVSKDANGQLRLSSSTAPEKMQYTDERLFPDSPVRRRRRCGQEGSCPGRQDGTRPPGSGGRKQQRSLRAASTAASGSGAGHEQPGH